MVLDRNEREFNPLRIFEEIAGRRWEETENDHATCEKNKEALNAEIKQHLREISMGVIKITKWSTIVNTNGTLTNTLNTDPRCIQGFTVEVKRKEEALLDNPYGSITEIKLAEYHRDDDFRRVIDTVVRFRFTGTEDSEVDFDASLLSHLNNPELNSPLTRLHENEEKDTIILRVGGIALRKLPPELLGFLNSFTQKVSTETKKVK